MSGRVAAMLAEFHEAFRVPSRPAPTTLVPQGERNLRAELLREEAQEFADAHAEMNLIEMADALADIVYVAYGTARTYGIDLDVVLAEVHRSNMSKLDEQGNPIYRHDGKVIKGPRYSPPDVAGVLGLPS